MPDGRFLRYYWQIRTLLDDQAVLLATDHPDYQVCEDYEVEYTGAFRASIVFRDGSRLIVRFSLQADDEVEEHDYVYQYLDPQGKRVFRYDDAPHHPEISTHPHHLHRGAEPSRGHKDMVHALDVQRVDFPTILAKIVAQYLSA